MSRRIKLAAVEIADCFFSRLRGLMFRASFEKPIVFVFNSAARHAIHALFVFFEFDAVFLDEEKKVVDIAERVKPFALLVVPKKKSRFLVEFPAGWVKRKKIKIGDSICW